MVYLIGVEHGVQSIPSNGPETSNHKAYRLCLEQVIRDYKPTVIAEEYSTESLDRVKYLNPSTTYDFFTRKIATNAGVEHIFCEPKLKVRFQLGCQGRAQWSKMLASLDNAIPADECDSLGIAMEINIEWPIREKYWLDQLGPAIKNEIVFVCGDGHLKTFADLLNSRGIPSSVVERKIGMTPELIKQSDSEVQYANENRTRIEGYYQALLKKYGGTIPKHPLLSQLERTI
jgi:hypothetical protein